MSYEQIIEYWFEILEPKDWWRKSDELDSEIVNKFKDIHNEVSVGNKVSWREKDEGRLAEIIVLDQFSRNMFRGQPEAFAYDTQALALTKAALDAGSADRLEQTMVSFLLMPFMHSESIQDHEMGLPLFEKYCADGTVDFERRHQAIIKRFGRYPHRNQILGRESSAEERVFLDGPGSSF